MRQFWVDLWGLMAAIADIVKWAFGVVLIATGFAASCNYADQESGYIVLNSQTIGMVGLALVALGVILMDHAMDRN